MSFWNGVETDGRKKLIFSIYHEGRKAVDNSFRSYYVEGGVIYQPTNALRISAFPSLNINRDQLQFIDNFDDVGGSPRYLNGEIDQRTLSMSVRLNYTINPNLTIQYWGQPFISRGRYSNFKHITDATAKRFEDRFVQYGADQATLSDGVYAIDEDLDNVADFSFDNPDFSFVQFRSNLVVRWEYIPGSEIFLVWSQDVSRSGDPTDGLLPSLGDNIFGQKPQNIFLLKATYRFVL